MSQLTEPDKCLGILHFLSNHLLHHISCMDVNGADCHDALSVTFRQITKQQMDQCVQLVHLFLVVILECCLKAFFHSTESNIYLCCPPDLSTSQSHLHNKDKEHYTNLDDLQLSKPLTISSGIVHKIIVYNSTIHVLCNFF